MPRITKVDLQNQINDLKEKIKSLENTLEQEETNFKNKIAELESSHTQTLQTKEDGFKDKEQSYTDTIETLEVQNKEKQNQLNKRELRKLAKAYETQEIEYAEDADKWFKYVIASFSVLVLSIIISILFVQGNEWYERVEVYLVNFVFITFLVFSLKQYSYYVKLRTDYANRKTLSQSYHNILVSGEDEEIKPKFLEKATDVLCAKNDVKHESYTLPEKLLESLTEITKNLSKKV
jgi:hypothetical protein